MLDENSCSVEPNLEFVSIFTPNLSWPEHA